MARNKSKIKPNLIKWLEALQEHEEAFGHHEISLSNEGWFQLYGIYFPHKDPSHHCTSLKQFSYYMSSISYDKSVNGFSRQIIRRPKYVVCYKLYKHTKHESNEDRSVEQPLTANNVNTLHSSRPPSKYISMP